MTSTDLDLDPCRHGEQNPEFCSICKNEVTPQRVIVYFTAGGQHFHWTASCSSLADGQKVVSDRGGTPALIDTGYLDTLRITRKPCKTCSR